MKKLIEITDEDILNLKNALDSLYKFSSIVNYELLEIFVIQDIIKQWKES